MAEVKKVQQSKAKKIAISLLLTLMMLVTAQAAEIMEARKIGLKSREQVVVELLEQYLG